MPVDVSQQLMPELAAGQLFWQSRSDEQGETHVPPPVEVDVEEVLVEVDVDVTLVVDVVVVALPPPFPPKPPSPFVSAVPDAQAAKIAGAPKASATKVIRVCFTMTEGTRVQGGIQAPPVVNSKAALPENRRRRWIFLVLLLFAGVFVYLPAIRAQYLIDDYLHASMVDGTYPAPRGPFDLYDFVNDADRTVLAERGMLPWWSHPRLKIRFFRPLPSALRWADQRIFGRAPLLPHLHSMLWWVAAVLAARSLFRRFLPPRPAWMATFVFALAPCHALPLAWLANREALVSLSFGALALHAYVRFREGEGLRHAALAALLFALSMSGGEYAICFGGYVLAYEIHHRGQSLPRRAAGLLPFALPAAAYLAVRAKLGYGTEGSGFYTDPFREPVAFLASAPRRLVTLLAEAWFSLDGETLTVGTSWWVLVLVAIAGAALCVLPVRRALAHADEKAAHHARWLLTGSFLSLLPVLAVVPSPRLLGAPLLGVAVVVALLLEHAWFPADPAVRSRAAELTGTAAIALGFAHLVHGPGTAWLTGWYYQKQSTAFIASVAELRARSTDAGRDQIYVLRGMGGSFFMPFALDPRGAPPPRWRMLGHTGHVLALRRDARTIDLIVPRGQGVFPAGTGNLFRDRSAVMKAGETYTLSGLRATILEVGPEGPRAVRFQLDRDLEEAPNLWIAETSKGFAEVAPPGPGFGQPFDP